MAVSVSTRCKVLELSRPNRRLLDARKGGRDVAAPVRIPISKMDAPVALVSARSDSGVTSDAPQGAA